MTINPLRKIYTAYYAEECLYFSFNGGDQNDKM